MSIFDHDFNKFPELTNVQLETLEFTSPHMQIKEDFEAEVVKVQDGDTITLRTDFRDFDFPLRLLDINAPESNELGGKESQQWLSSLLLNEKVNILIDRNQRVGKYGRLLGVVMHKGLNINEISMSLGYSTSFEAKNEGKIPDFALFLNEAAI